MSPEPTLFPKTFFPIFRAEILERDNVYHGFLGRPRPAVDGDRSAALRACADQLGIPSEQVIILRQMHGDRVHVLRKGEAIAPGPPPCADVMVTNLGGFYLCIRTADCVPILFLDPVAGVVAAAHAGWRGTARKVAARAVKAMQVLFGSRAQNIRAALGPAIGACCYEVDKPVVDLMLENNPDCWQFLNPGRQGHWMLDLQALNAHQIVKAGLREENVQKISICTACRTDFFYSRRGEKGIKGEQFSLIGLTP